MAITLNGTTGITTDIDGDESLTLNRDTSDGNIITLEKDNTTVGSIGAYDGRPYLASTTLGIRVSNAFFPSNTSGVITDGACNIGGTSGRFKDLYLSGGVYVGGTGSANHLDDYEEGTWTPVFVNGTVTYGNRSGVYTKVGGLVQASFMVSWTALSGLYEPRITLPFNATSSTNYRGSGAVGYMKGVDFGTSVNASWITTANQGDVNLVLNYDNATPSWGNINDWSSSGEIQGTIIYRTDS